MKTDEILKTISLRSNREILKQLAKKPMTVGELRKRAKKLKNRVSFYKSLNKMTRLGILKRRRDPEVKRFVYELSKTRVVINLSDNKLGGMEMREYVVEINASLEVEAEDRDEAVKKFLEWLAKQGADELEANYMTVSEILPPCTD